MTQRTFLILAIAWVVLALSTLYLVVTREDAVWTAATAWSGGIITCLLYQRLTGAIRRTGKAA